MTCLHLKERCFSLNAATITARGVVGGLGVEHIARIRKQMTSVSGMVAALRLKQRSFEMKSCHDRMTGRSPSPSPTRSISISTPISISIAIFTSMFHPYLQLHLHLDFLMICHDWKTFMTGRHIGRSEVAHVCTRTHTQTPTNIHTYSHTGVCMCVWGGPGWSLHGGACCLRPCLGLCGSIRVLARAAGTYGNIRDGAPTARTSGMMHAFLEELSLIHI